MSSMVMECFETDFYLIETSNGTELVLAELVPDKPKGEDFKDYLEGCISIDAEIEKQHGWVAQLTMPGYMDCTGYCYGETEREAQAQVHEYHCGDDPEYDEPTEGCLLCEEQQDEEEEEEG